MSKRQPVQGQAVTWCVCGEWFASARDEREHASECPGPRERQSEPQRPAGIWRNGARVKR